MNGAKGIQPLVTANALQQQQQPWQQVCGRGCGCGQSRGCGCGRDGRPYSRPAGENAPTNDSKAQKPLVAPGNTQWEGQMQGQKCGPNWERNCACQKADAAEKKAAKSAEYTGSAHIVACIGGYDITDEPIAGSSKDKGTQEYEYFKKN